MDCEITHNTAIEPEAHAREARPKRRVQAYASTIGDEEQVWVDLNGAPLSLLTLSPGDTRRLIAILRAALADLSDH
jgi:hypothetical protein